MPRLTPSRLLFGASALLPYLLDCLPVHFNDDILSTAFLDFMALLVLATSSLVLLVQALRQRRYILFMAVPVITIVAVIFYFYSFDYRKELRENAYFYFLRPDLESCVSLLNSKNSLSAADSLKLGYSNSYYDRQISYDKLPSGIILCTTEGQASEYFGGYAYSPNNCSPADPDGLLINGKLTVWRKITDKWYRYVRADN